MNRTAAIVPVKSFDLSKSRLAPVLSDEERQALSVRLLERVLSALQTAHSVDVCWVVGGDDAVEALATQHDARWSPELGAGLNDTLARALERLPQDVTAALILPMDLPFLTGQAVDALVKRLSAEPADVVIAPDRWARGTNGLLLTRPFALRPAFGPHSFDRHRERAGEQGLRVVLHHAPEFAFDVDTPADLADADLLTPGGVSR